MAESTAKTIELTNAQQSANKIFYIKGTKAAQNDVFTVTGLTSVIGAYLQFAAGTIETETFGTNIITLTSATTGTFSGICWGT